MDDADNSPVPRPAPARGGTVEPANRASVAKDLFQTPLDLPRERYELRDPFADVTYRATSFPEIVAKADQLGSSRFVAVDAQGNRTTVQKVNGEWQRGPRHPATPEHSAFEKPARAEAPQPTNIVPLPKPAMQPEAPIALSMARIDAQAEHAARVAQLEAALIERYLIKRAPVTVGDVTIGRTEYRFRGDTSRVAFTESTFRLATDTNSPSVARSMVDVAETRNWRALRVSGNEDFKRMVWLEASVRGVRTLGYEPHPASQRLAMSRLRHGWSTRWAGSGSRRQRAGSPKPLQVRTLRTIGLAACAWEVLTEGASRCTSLASRACMRASSSSACRTPAAATHPTVHPMNRRRSSPAWGRSWGRRSPKTRSPAKRP